MIPTIICFSHLRWNFVFQRPQHLMMRFATRGKVLFVEEPVFNSGWNGLRVSLPLPGHQLTVLVPHLFGDPSEDEKNRLINGLLIDFLAAEQVSEYICWYYSPMAIEFSSLLTPLAIVYDCMDELSAFKFAPQRLQENEKLLLTMAAVVFTGGHTLYAAKRHLHHNIHAFPSSIDKAHFMRAREIPSDPDDQATIPHPRIGFYGVLDERLDVDLVRTLASERPDWHFILLGPTVKIDPASLPRAHNIHYTGAKSYDELPHYLAGWDIAFMPFAINESTRYISPTKTPEYLSAGKRVISTPIADVVNDYGSKGLVQIAHTPEEFIMSAERILSGSDDPGWLSQVDDHLKDDSWDNTWSRMVALIETSVSLKRDFNNNYLRTCSITL